MMWVGQFIWKLKKFSEIFCPSYIAKTKKLSHRTKIFRKIYILGKFFSRTKISVTGPSLFEMTSILSSINL